MGTCENCWRSDVWVENHLCKPCSTHFNAALFALLEAGRPYQYGKRIELPKLGPMGAVMDNVPEDLVEQARRDGVRLATGEETARLLGWCPVCGQSDCKGCPTD